MKEETKIKLRRFYRKYNKWALGFIIFIVFALSVNAELKEYEDSFKLDDMEEVTYPEFLELVNNGDIDTVYCSDLDENMYFTLYNNDTRGMSLEEREDYNYELSSYRKTKYPSYKEFKKDILEKGINIEKTKLMHKTEVISASFIVIYVFVIILFIKYLTSLSRTASDNGDIIQRNVETRFTDVIGQEEVIEDIKFIVKLLQNPKLGDSVGAKVPKGILLAGEPGTGKTLIARAIAGEAGVPFLSTCGSDFKELFVGLGAKRVRKLFKLAKLNAPCVVFIDELDAVGSERGDKGRNSEDDSTLNALLKEMDGFSVRDGIFIIAATNRPDVLDSAIKRSGRFDRQININPPRDWKVRKELLDFYLSNSSLAENVNTENLSKQLAGFTGADIAMICNEAGIIALMQNKEYIDMGCLEEAIDKKIFNGNRSKREKHEKDKQIVAYHEAGHAVMSYLMKQPIARASIISTTNGVGGFVMQTESDSFFVTDKELKAQIYINFGGRAAEHLKFDAVTTGATNDINVATSIMLDYVQKYGFDENFGMLDVSVLEKRQLVDANTTIKRLSDMSKKMYSETTSMLREHIDMLDRLAKKLLEVETLSGEEIEKILNN